MFRHLPRSTLFPYTTLFRSPPEIHHRLSREELEMIVADKSEGISKQNSARPRWRDLLKLPQTWGTIIAKTFTDPVDRKSTRLNSSHANISYAVFCLKKKRKT